MGYDLETVLKIVQIGFYVTVGTIAVLTYRSAKNTLLNSLNTEYHKREFDRLEWLASELLSELDEESENFWIKDNSLEETISKINSGIIKREKGEELNDGELMAVESSSPSPKHVNRFDKIANLVRSDPFLPNEIRERVVSFYNNRSEKTMVAWILELKTYKNEFENGQLRENSEINWAIVSNRINKKLYDSGVGIGDAMKEIHELRELIRRYLKKFDPLKTTSWNKNV